jgi:uncharacterized protein YcbX
MRVIGLYVHPVKGCRAVALDDAMLGPLGLESDRRFAFVREDGCALTQRDVSSLATIRPQLDDEQLRLDLGGLAELSVPLKVFSELASVDVWGKRVPGRAAPDGVAARVAEYLGAHVRLVMLDAQAQRAFVDSQPVLVTTTGMLGELGLPGIGMERFRPNLVLEGAERWAALRGTDVLLESEKPCGRCEVTTIDQASGERRGPEPLRTLTERFAGKFGIYCRVARGGRLRLGEVLRVA